MKTFVYLLLAQFALVYTDVSHLTKNYLPPHMAHMTPTNGMRTLMTFEQHELQELPEQIVYVQELQQKPADVMDQHMMQQYAANMQYFPPNFQMQQQHDVKPKMLPMVKFMVKQMEQQQQHWQQVAESMPQMPQDMQAMQYMQPETLPDTYSEPHGRQIYPQQLMRQPEINEQRMEMLPATHFLDVPAMQQQYMIAGEQQHAEQMTHILANDGYHYKTAQKEAQLQRLRH